MTGPGPERPWADWPSPTPRQQPDGRLRPLSVSGLFDVAGRILRRHAKVLLGIALCVQLAGTVLDGAAELRLGDTIAPLLADMDTDTPRILVPTDTQTSAILGALGLVVVAMLVSTILGAVATVGYATTVLDDYEGRHPSLGRALRLAFRRGLPAIAAALLALAIPMAVAAVAALSALVVMGTLPGSPDGGGPGVFLALIVGVGGTLATLALLVRLVLAPIVVGVEGTGPLRALRRSWRLTADHAWRTFWVLVLVAFVVGVLGSLLAQLLGALLTDTLGTQLGLVDPFDLVISVGVALLFLPVPVVVQTVLYLDLRVRRDAWQPSTTDQVGQRVGD